MIPTADFVSVQRGVYNDKQSLVLPGMGWITIGTIGGLLIRLAIWSIFLTPKGDLQDLTIIRFVLWVTWILWSLVSSPWPTQVHKVQNAAHGGGTRVGPGGMAHTVTVSKLHEIWTYHQISPDITRYHQVNKWSDMGWWYALCTRPAKTCYDVGVGGGMTEKSF